MERVEQAMLLGLRHAMAWIHMPIGKLYFRMRVEGISNVPREGPAVLCPNHESFLDPPALNLALYFPSGFRLVRYMALERYFQGPSGWYVRLFGSFPVPEGGVPLPAFRKALGTLRSGRLLGIFPEGARSLDGHLLPFRPGAARIATEADVPIVPVTINGTHEAWPRGTPCPRPRPIEVIYHPPIATDHDYRKDQGYLAELTERIREAVASRHDAPTEEGEEG